MLLASAHDVKLLNIYELSIAAQFISTPRAIADFYIGRATVMNDYSIGPI